MESVKKDVRKALEVMEGDLLTLFEPAFHSHSTIYSATNEKISSEKYKDILRNKEKILSVIGSGDQILNSILFGSKDITGFDISRFTGYYLKLKVAALKSLQYDEYLSFFSCQSKNRFSKGLYEKTIPYLDSDTEFFWTIIFNYSKDKLVGIPNLFVTVSSENFKNNNPYLESKDKYDLLKSKMNDIDLNLIYGDIFDLVHILPDKYSLVNLSNIVDYYVNEILCENNSIMDIYSKEKLISFLRSVPIDENGVILMYSMKDFISRLIVKDSTTSEIEFEEYDINGRHKLILSRKRK